MSWDLNYQKEYLRRLLKRLRDLGITEDEELIRKINREIDGSAGDGRLETAVGLIMPSIDVEAVVPVAVALPWQDCSW